MPHLKFKFSAYSKKEGEEMYIIFEILWKSNLRLETYSEWSHFV